MRFNPFLRCLHQIICPKIKKESSSKIRKGKQINRHISKLLFYKDKLTEIMPHQFFFFFFLTQLGGERARSAAWCKCSRAWLGLSVNGLFIGGAERGFAFYSPRYGNAVGGRKMLTRIKGISTRSVSREASVTLQKLRPSRAIQPPLRVPPHACFMMPRLQIYVMRETVSEIYF